MSFLRPLKLIPFSLSKVTQRFSGSFLKGSKGPMAPASIHTQIPLNCKEPEAQRGERTFLRPHSWLQGEPGLGSKMRSPGETLSSSFQNLGCVRPPSSFAYSPSLYICALFCFHPFTAVLVRFIEEAEVYTMTPFVVYPTVRFSRS